MTDESDSSALSRLAGTTPKRVKKIARSYKCPNCGGEFDSWRSRSPARLHRTRHCPFCDLERGEYDPDGGDGR